ncbi:predicted protein [Streptomyces albidoflavus]|nr:predicted protein [Streptomyces albidoflavus]
MESTPGKRGSPRGGHDPPPARFGGRPPPPCTPSTRRRTSPGEGRAPPDRAGRPF